MGCREASTWLCACPPIAAAAASRSSFKPEPFFFKPRFSGSINGPADSMSSSSSSTASYSRQWHNPLRIRQIHRPVPEVVRHWVEAEPPVVNHRERFMVVSYNILGDRNASKHRDLYPNIPAIYMTWDRRKRVICEELIGWNPVIICLQMRKAESRRFLIGNIHVLYNPSRGDVKLGQIRTLSSKARTLSEKWGNVPVVLAGDYNSTPQSAIYEFLSSSKLNILLHDRKELSGQRSCHPAQVFGIERETGNPFDLMDRCFKYCWTDEEVKVAAGNAESQVVVHPLKLYSSYATVKGSTRTRGFNGEPLATSYHAKFIGTVDYLWYSDGLLPTRVLDTLPINVLQKTGGLPCEILGSDHLALVSEFAFIPTKEKRM